MSTAWIAKEVEGKWIAECPHCHKQDCVVEVDRGIRWNQLILSSATVGTVKMADDEMFEPEGWICSYCFEQVSEPDGFECTGWA